VPLRHSTGRVPEEHALHVAVDDDTASDHVSYSRRRGSEGDPEAAPDGTRLRTRADPARDDRTDRGNHSACAERRLQPGTTARRDGRRHPEADRGHPRREQSRAALRRKLEQWLNAPVLIVVGVREDDYHERYRKQDKLTDGAEIEWPIPYWHFDAGAAAMLILLAAIDEGYAAGLFGVFAGATPSFKELLCIPGDIAVACCITIGKPADDSQWSAISSRSTQTRKSVDDLVHWERWA
jgi:nitroreductase